MEIKPGLYSKCRAPFRRIRVLNLKIRTFFCPSNFVNAFNRGFLHSNHSVGPLFPTLRPRFTEKRLFNILTLLVTASLGLSVFFNGVDVSAQTQSNKIIVDNFEKPGKTNLLGGEFGAFNDKSALGYCYLFFVENKEKEVPEGNRYSLYLQWDTSKEGAYGGFWTDLKHVNLEGINYVTFHVKGAKGGEKFKVGLRGKREDTYETKILIQDVLSGGVTTQWQKVVIPLKQFKAVQDWSDVNLFSISFEYAFGSGKGAIVIDEIAFEK